MKYLYTVLLSCLSVYSFAQHEIQPTNKFEITGDIRQDLEITSADILKYQKTDIGDVTIRNHKGDEKGIAHHLEGVLVKDILDSIGIVVDRPAELSEYYFVFVASDNYKNVFSWNEIFNTETGDKLYIITAKEGKDINTMEGRIQVLSTADRNTGRRYLKGLARIEVKRVR